MTTPENAVENAWGTRGASLAPSTSSAGKYSVLSSTERQIISECQDEAFYYRSLPLSMCFCFGTHTLFDLEFGNWHSRVPRLVRKCGYVAGAGILGFSVGQIAYSNQCADKFLDKAPEGVIAEDIRMKGM